jgi:hypothetical protein
VSDAQYARSCSWTRPSPRRRVAAIDAGITRFGAIDAVVNNVVGRRRKRGPPIRQSDRAKIPHDQDSAEGLRKCVLQPTPLTTNLRHGDEASSPGSPEEGGRATQVRATTDGGPTAGSGTQGAMPKRMKSSPTSRAFLAAAFACTSLVTLPRTALADDVPIPPQAPPPPGSTVSFEGSEALVSLDGAHACTAPCELHGIAPGPHALTVDGKPARDIVVGADRVDVGLRSGSPLELVGGIALMAGGTALLVGGITAHNNCQNTYTTKTGPVAMTTVTEHACISVPRLLDVTGALTTLGGIALTVAGGRALAHTSVVLGASPVASAKGAPRVFPWAAAEQNLHGGVGGVAVVF